MVKWLNSNKLLIISGPTATGKTGLAIKLAKKFNGELISADSRQIYRGMDIGTGKDHPRDTKIHLIDIINPDQIFSVAQYRRLAIKKITEIHQKNKLPIIVGGTGQYIDSIINPQPTFSIKPNNLLRFFLNKFPVPILQKIFYILDKKSYSKLNNSDINNPHRLIRKIEIKLNNFFNSPYEGERPEGTKGFNYLHISLTAPNQLIYSRINARVQQRLESGLFNEIKNLLKKYHWSDPGLNCLAYKEFKEYFLGTHDGILLQDCIQKWLFDEHSYARRQKTWFKKIPHIIFFDISRPAYPKNVIRLVKKWYN